MRVLTFFIILLSTWFGMPITQAEGVESILLKHQVSGYMVERGEPVPWSEELENPMSEMSETYKYYIKYSVQILAQSVNIVIENQTITFWKKNDVIWVDYSFCFRVSNWSNNDEWHDRLIKNFYDLGVPYVVEKYGTTQPVYSSFIKEYMDVEGEEGTPYRTSSELTYEFVYNGNNWSDDLTDTESEQYRRKCYEINDNINSVYDLMRVLPNVTHKCIFWSTGKDDRGSVSTVISFEVDHELNKLNDFDVFEKQFNQYYMYLSMKCNWSHTMKVFIIVHTSPINYPKQNDATSESTTPIASTNIPTETTMATFPGEDDGSIVLRYHSTGNGFHEGIPEKWFNEYENPSSLGRKLLVNVIKKQVWKALLDFAIELENLDVVVWNNTNFVGADVAFNFRIQSWRDTDYWQHAIVTAFSASEKPWYVEEFSSTHPVYSSFLREPLYIMGGEGAPYLTSSELTYEFTCNYKVWSEQLFRPGSQEYNQKCWEINEYINEVYAKLGVIGMRYHKCVFWQIGKEVRLAATILIPFDRNGTFDALDNQKVFREQFAKQYKIVQEQWNLNLQLKKAMTIHTTPAQCPNPAMI